MKQLCFIGTSHLAALAHAWFQGESARYSKFQASFFAGGGSSLYEAEFSPNTIKAPIASKLAENFQRSAQGETTINLDQYDYFIFQGLDYPIIEILRLSLLLAKHEQFFSSDCLKNGFIHHLESQPITPCIQHILHYTTAPIIISTTPKTSYLALQNQPLEYSSYLLYADFFELLFLTAKHELFNDPRLTLIKQPEETLATPFFTKTDYLNKTCFAKHHDYWHKTPNYGQAVLKKIFAQLTD
ncbi:hypothetical protein SAMN02745130_03817 [Thiothrix eikelboomii]|uniref:Uncharacterized protein n=1 Tax=Thiothrix eikelboomii TaxID=92487 RepID=A0A1T4Y213_9GAMM|nr:hypothetical protein [Thiothrix eikelboomii]SKA95806.1 hypothetical protein SAMN02745130_03817 [Thiothrix eikelboomii]